MKYIFLAMALFSSCVLLANAGLDIEKTYEIIESVQPGIVPETSILDVILTLSEKNAKYIYAIYSDSERNWHVITEDASITLDGSTLTLVASETLTEPFSGKPKVSITDALALVFLSETEELQAIFLEEVNNQLKWQIFVGDLIVSVDPVTPAILKKENRETKLKEVRERLAPKEKKEHPEKPEPPSPGKPDKPPKNNKEGNKK